MKICATIGEMRAETARWRRAGQSIALVPTMGFLHEGHMALVRRARALADFVVVWIFVNPTQFEDAGDLATYPRDMERDLALLRAEDVDAVFTPDAAEIYPAGSDTIVEVQHLSRILLGQHRPGHFRGVTTVVTKFFNIIRPDFAIFGEKDYQQLQVIRRMVRDLHMDVEITAVPTVREPDGLAMSSRNVRLSPEDRRAASVLFRALEHAKSVATRGLPVDQLRPAIEDIIQAEPRARLEAVDIVDAETLEEIEGALDGPAAILLSARFGDVRLIDQMTLNPEGE